VFSYYPVYMCVIVILCNIIFLYLITKLKRKYLRAFITVAFCEKLNIVKKSRAAIIFLILIHLIYKMLRVIMKFIQTCEVGTCCVCNQTSSVCRPLESLTKSNMIINNHNSFNIIFGYMVIFETLLNLVIYILCLMFQ